MKKLHISRSLKTCCERVETPLVRPILRCKIGRPGAITLHAKFKGPIRDWSSCRVVDRLGRDSHKGGCWSAQSCALAAWLPFYVNLERLPWTEELCRGPPLFWLAEIGILKVLKVPINVWQRLGRHSGNWRFSYKKVIQNVTDKGYCSVILQYPPDGIREPVGSELNGVERSPKGSTLSKW